MGASTRLVDAATGSDTGDCISSACLTIQYAIGQAADGDTVSVAAGTYYENVSVNKKITLDGAGDGNTASDTIISSAQSPANNGLSTVDFATGGTGPSDQVVVQDVRITGSAQRGVSYGANVGYVTLHHVTLDSTTRGIEFQSTGVNNLLLDDVDITNNSVGIRAGTAAGVSNLTIRNSNISNNNMGTAIFATSSNPSNETLFTGITIEDTNISSNLQKGLYFEKLDDALLQRLTVTDSGTDATYAFNNGIDINLKHGSYDNIQIIDSTFDGSGLLTTLSGGMDFSAALALKARSDAPSYNTVPATATGIEVANNKFIDSTTDIRVGEPGKNNPGPTATTITDNSLAGLDNASTAAVDASANWWGSNVEATVAAASSGASIDFTPYLHSGVDESVDPGFQGDFSTLDVTTLGSQTGSTGRVQEGIDLVSGSVVNVAAGNYGENVNANKTVDLRGAQYGVAVGGRTFGAATESTISGVSTAGSSSAIRISAADVSVDGFSLRNNSNVTGAAIGVSVTSTGGSALIQNNIVDNVTTADTGGNGTAQAVYLEGGPDNVEILDNLFNNITSNRSAKGVLIGDSASTNPSTGVTIDDNVMTSITSATRGAYGVQVNNGGGSTTNSGLTITDNSISGLTASGEPGWVHAIGLEANTPSATVSGNVISSLTDMGTTALDQAAVWFEANSSIASVNVDRNSLAVGNDRKGVALHPTNQPAGTADAECNWWGDAAGPNSTNGSDTQGTVDVEPWLESSDLDGACEGVALEGVLEPAEHDFGDQVVGTTSAPFTFTFTNEGHASLNVTGVALAGTHPGQFEIDTNNCDSASLGHDQSCSINVVFEPNSTGAKSARLEIESNDPDSPAQSDLNGNGVSAPAPGSIRIILDSLPNGAQDFVFNGDLGTFTLDDDSNATRPRLRDFFSLAPGTYDVTQSTDPAAWSLFNITCTTGESTSVSTRTATITLAPGEEVVCTFVNVLRRPDGLISKSLNSGYTGGNIYSATPLSSQTQKRNNVARNRTFSYFVRARNNSQRMDSLRLDATEGGAATMSVTYFVDGVDETSAILAGTFVTDSLAAGAFELIEIRVHVAGNAVQNAQRTVNLAIRSDSKPAQIDVVRAITKR